MGYAWVGIAFWAWLAAVVIAEEIGTTKRRRADLDLLRFSIEKGQPLTTEVIQQLFAKPTTPLFVSGIVTLTSGVGVIIFSIFLARLSSKAGWIVAGAGSIAMCVGAGLIISYRLIRRDQPSVPQS